MGETSSGTVTTERGTPVAYRRSGKGPPMVLIHGTAADHSRWRPVLVLEERFTVYAIDRRGRGAADSRIVVMDQQGHSAMDTGTDLFTAKVLRFLQATKGG